MNLYLFNPEHDIMLAADRDVLTPPRAARQLRHDLGFLPALWAGAADVVLVDDVVFAREAFAATGRMLQATLADHNMARRLFASAPAESLRLCPWGWDRPVVREMRLLGIPDSLLPSPSRLAAIRGLSHRAWAAGHLLKPLRSQPGTVGEACEATTAEACLQLVRHYSAAVVKAPWSSSGRGVRCVKASDITPSLNGWVTRVVAEQGSIMVEPYYSNKVLDFGVEFMSDGCGSVSLSGLSLFHVERGAYVGNLVLGEDRKWQLLEPLVGRQRLAHVVDHICNLLGPALNGVYAGPLGVDMMVVRDAGGRLCLHPCVEMNLRATMGHVALRV